jgi:hypothetical protein
MDAVELALMEPKERSAFKRRLARAVVLFQDSLLLNEGGSGDGGSLVQVLAVFDRASHLISCSVELESVFPERDERSVDLAWW